MNVSLPFIKRPVFTTLVMVTLIFFGAICYVHLPRAAFPSIEFPTIEVTTSYPGASPDEMAKLVSSPLERQFMLMQGIKMVSSSNTYQTSSIILQFYLDVDIDIAAQETEEAIQKAMGQLPKDLPNTPTYTKTNPTDTPIVYAALYSKTIPPWTLYTWGYSFLGQQMGTVQGLANIQTYGFPYAVRVFLDPQALSARDISLEEVSTALNNANPDQPTGKFYGPNLSVDTITNGQLTKAEYYNSVIIKFIDGAPVRLKDIGYAEDSLENDKEAFQWVDHETPDGTGAVVLAMYRQLGYNTVEACEDVVKKIAELQGQIPAAIDLVVPFVESKWILQAVAEVEFTLLLAFLLVTLVVYIYLGKLRNSAIPLITLPITVTGTFVIMYIVGYSIDIMSMSALTLGIGFLVDDAIVVLENIVRWVQQEGLSPYKAAIRGSGQIIITVLSISLCLAAAFLPMLFMKGAVGRLFHEFAGVIIIAILISGFISLSLTPMLSSRFIPAYTREKKTRMEKASDWINDKMLSLYRPALNFALHHKVWVLLGGVSSIFLSIVLLKVMPREFLPENDLGFVQCFAKAPEGTSPAAMTTYMEQVAKLALDNPYVENLAWFKSTPTDNQCIFFLNLIPIDKRPNIWEVMRETQKSFDTVIGVQVVQKAFPLINLQVGGMDSGKAKYQYILQSFETPILYKSASEFIERMRLLPEVGTVASDFQPNSPMVDVKILRDQAHAYGELNAMSVENAFMYAYGETYISRINVPQNMYYVIMELEDRFLTNPTQLSKLYLGKNEDQVSIRSVVDTEVISGPLTVNHINALPSVTVEFDIAPGVALSDTIAAVQDLSKQILPDSVMGSLAGNTEEFEKSSTEFTAMLILAIFIIYIILGCLYENFLHPLTPLVGIPVATLGGLLTLLIFHQVLSIYALVGVFMLMGIVMKNGILVVDFALEEMEKGLSPQDAAYKACLIRFRPIVMTTIAAMMGSVPIALGIGGTVAEGRAPLGIAVVGGLIFSQTVTLFVTPAVFVYVCKLQHFFVSRFHIFQEKEE